MGRADRTKAPHPATDGVSTASTPESPQSETCEVCGSADTWWRNCKLLCRGCGSIVKSCADL